MNDLTDAYIQHSLKNWAALQQPPANARARLLLVASAAVSHLDSRLARADGNGHFVPLASNRPPAERCIKPFNESFMQNKLWPLHMALIPFRSMNVS